jgi:hypothetical protein
LGQVVELDQDVLELGIFDFGQDRVEFERVSALFEAAVSLKQLAGGCRREVVVGHVGQRRRGELGIQDENFE